MIMCLINTDYTKQQLIDELGISKSQVNQNVGKLLQKGLVQLKLNATDGYRALSNDGLSVFSITQAGVEQVRIGVWK